LTSPGAANPAIHTLTGCLSVAAWCQSKVKGGIKLSCSVQGWQLRIQQSLAESSPRKIHRRGGEPAFNSAPVEV
ncbi:mCG145957, partial [Mus musculus]